jgi:hypothetical protein
VYTFCIYSDGWVVRFVLLGFSLLSNYFQLDYAYYDIYKLLFAFNIGSDVLSSVGSCDKVSNGSDPLRQAS